MAPVWGIGVGAWGTRARGSSRRRDGAAAAPWWLGRSRASAWQPASARWRWRLRRCTRRRRPVSRGEDKVGLCAARFVSRNCRDTWREQKAEDVRLVILRGEEAFSLKY
jgi:hypothetical protein